MTRRIGVNLTWLIPGVVGGSEESTVAALGAVAPFVDAGRAELVLLGSAELFSAHPGLAGIGEVVEVASAGESRLRRIGGEATTVVSVARERGVDLMHHGGGVLPLRSTRPATVAVHDIQPLDVPANFSAAKRGYLGAMLRRTVRAADRVGVPSEFVRQRLIDRLGAPGDRIDVVPWCVLETSAGSPTDVEEIRRRHGLDGDYVIFPAVTHPHKNHDVLLAAVRRGAPMPTVVFCGGRGGHDAAVREVMSTESRSNAVRHLGRVPREDLLGLVAGAAALVFPSRYEGFGLPVLEAMSAGVPVVAASAGSLPEVVGDAGMLLDPDDVDGWAAALRRVVDDESWAAGLATRGRERAARFGAEVTGEALWRLWEKAMLERP